MIDYKEELQKLETNIKVETSNVERSQRIITTWKKQMKVLEYKLSIEDIQENGYTVEELYSILCDIDTTDNEFGTTRVNDDLYKKLKLDLELKTTKRNIEFKDIIQQGKVE